MLLAVDRDGVDAAGNVLKAGVVEARTVGGPPRATAFRQKSILRAVRVDDPQLCVEAIGTAPIDRIDVLTGGASSVYGSDAIAGVVNFVLKKNFQGLQFDTQLGEDWHNQHNSVMHTDTSNFGLTPLSGNVQDGRNRTWVATDAAATAAGQRLRSCAAAMAQST